MQITSDDDFEDLTEPTTTQNRNIVEVQQSMIRTPIQMNNFRVQILEVENQSEMGIGIVENQYYYVLLMKNQKPYNHSEPLKRRFSDFDMLFEILFNKYKGKILPGFPEKGIVSYMKTKVTMVKDKEYLTERILMVERFMTSIVNDPQFNIEVCEETRKFFSEKEFELFKKAEKEKSQGLFSSSWNKLKNYIKIGKQNKYKIVSDKLVEDKKDFESLYEMAKTTQNLLEEQEKQSISYTNCQFKYNKYAQYCERANKIGKKQKKNLESIKNLVFQLYCQNEDYLMVLKIIQSIEELRSNEDNCKILKGVEDKFGSQQSKFEERKKKQLLSLKKKVIQVLEEIQKIDQQF